ncbi:MAG: leucine-rich repeat domain-containing protein [Lachnospiraceae bacterium]|nr:leucine-rich repeat domain-containing protein [Lachnospiraceae bacterium]
MKIIDVDVAKDYYHRFYNKIRGIETSTNTIHNEEADPTVPVVDLVEKETHTNTNEYLGMTFTYSVDAESDNYQIGITEDYKVEDVDAAGDTRWDMEHPILIYSTDLCLLYGITYNKENDTFTFSDIYKSTDLPTDENNETPINIAGYEIKYVSFDRGTIKVILNDEKRTVIVPYLDSFTCGNYKLYADSNGVVANIDYNSENHLYEISLDEEFTSVALGEEVTEAPIYWCVLDSDDIVLGGETYEQSFPFSKEFICAYDTEKSAWDITYIKDIQTIDASLEVTDVANGILINGTKKYAFSTADEDGNPLINIADADGNIVSSVKPSHLLTKANKDELTAKAAYDKLVNDAAWENEDADWGEVKLNNVLYSSTGDYVVVNGLAEKLTSVEFPETVYKTKIAEIAEEALKDNDELTSVVINHVKFIRKNAFNNCKKLSEIDIKSGLLGIESGAFVNCNSEGYTITIPDSVIYISQGAFDMSNVIIKCNTNSYAENFAKNHNIKYILLDDKTVDGTEPAATAEATGEPEATAAAEATEKPENDNVTDSNNL